VTTSGPRASSVGLASSGGVACVGLAMAGARRPRRALAVVTGAFACVALPLAMAAVILQIAPFAFEVPQPHCPFCLLRGDVAVIGYPLFGAMLLGAIWLFGAAASAILANASARDAWPAFASSRFKRRPLAWA